LLFKIEHICMERGCGYRATTLHTIITDNIKNAILSINMKCPRCNATMINNPIEINAVFSANKNSVNFINTKFINYREGAIDINIGDLLHSGFSGTVILYNNVGREKYILDSINMTIKKVK